MSNRNFGMDLVSVTIKEFSADLLKSATQTLKNYFQKQSDDAQKRCEDEQRNCYGKEWDGFNFFEKLVRSKSPSCGFYEIGNNLTVDWSGNCGRNELTSYVFRYGSNIVLTITARFSCSDNFVNLSGASFFVEKALKCLEIPTDRYAAVLESARDKSQETKHRETSGIYDQKALSEM